MEWISVKTRLPEDILEFVLVSRNKGNKSVMEANYIDGVFMVHRYGDISPFINPTHWQPYPPPPTNKEEL